MKRTLLFLLFSFSMFFTGCNNVLNLLVMLTAEPEPVRAPVFTMGSMIGDEPTLNILLMDDKVFYYVGGNVENTRLTRLHGNPSITDVVVKAQVEQQENFKLLIKECKSANLASLDALLQILTNVHILKYALADPSKKEEAYLTTLAGNTVFK